MAINFPNTPTINDIFTSGTQSWVWTGTVWDLLTGTQVNTVTGTTNQVTASPTSGAVVLTTPQDIATTSSPTFAVMTLNAASGSKLSLSGATSNWVDFSAAGVAAPTYTTARSAGTKIVLYPGFVAGSSADYAIGIEGFTQWFSVPNTDFVGTPYQFKWYGGTSLAATLTGAGVLTLVSTAQATRFISTVATGTAPLAVTSTTKVANLNADFLDDQTGSYYLDLVNATGTLPQGHLAGYVLHSTANGQCTSYTAPTTTTLTDVTGATVTITCAVGDLIKITGHFDGIVTANNGVIVGQLAVAGISNVGPAGSFGRASDVAPQGGAFTITYWYTATLTTHTFKLQGRMGAGATASAATLTTNTIIWTERYVPA